MRLHRLEVTAIGPYAGTEVLDFDDLNDGGIFLLTGPTGAGKSSILDAVCFALYGVVPGERGVRTLRSHHADPATRPEVVLELTLAGRRYRVRRSPEWTRPKRRGSGTTKEPASASLMEVTEGQERLVSARAAEVGHTLGELLGMGSEQFMQVVLLPQGEFARFLHAKPAQRQEILVNLLGLHVYQRIGERAGIAQREAEARAAATRSLLGDITGADEVALDAAAQALARGDFDHRVEVAGHDELRRLGAVFNDMARRLREL